MEIAVVAVAYNRVDSLSRLISSLERSYYPEDKNVTLIVSIDKSNTDVVEKYAESYHWPYGDKIIDKHEKNLGLREHMLSLGKWFEKFDAIVVLEDDIVVSPNFYTYTCQSVEKYYCSEVIAGISLYSFGVNYQTGQPFVPVKDEHDAYFMNCAMSWGEVWMRDSWKKFYDWYLCHQDFPVTPQLPYTICSWGKKSWLKYHTRYCIEENKFFVHPYASLTTNYGDAGEHSAGSTIFQVPLQFGKVMNYHLPDVNGHAIHYDGFFENKQLCEILGYSEDDLCIDLQGGNHNKLNKRYWLTLQVTDYYVAQSFGLYYRPIEMNVILKAPGKQVFLYDTQNTAVSKTKVNSDVMLYRYNINSMFFFVRKYGFINLLKDTIIAFKQRFF